ncbi:hypothetical protein LEP1GSC049_0729 [Leptospira kirschneri serovar Cynopteri str. 3522 CT]|nr:hypothetical protein LEP1GSC049_0729 [Leptospira kirschneri serovar Cynopteri str. 3522 CT]
MVIVDCPYRKNFPVRLFPGITLYSFVNLMRGKRNKRKRYKCKYRKECSKKHLYRGAGDFFFSKQKKDRRDFDGKE